MAPELGLILGLSTIERLEVRQLSTMATVAVAGLTAIATEGADSFSISGSRGVQID